MVHGVGCLSTNRYNLVIYEQTCIYYFGYMQYMSQTKEAKKNIIKMNKEGCQHFKTDFKI